MATDSLVEADRQLSPDLIFFADNSGETSAIRQNPSEPVSSVDASEVTPPQPPAIATSPESRLDGPPQAPAITTTCERPMSPESRLDNPPQAPALTPTKRPLSLEKRSGDSLAALAVTPSKRPRFFRSPSPPKSDCSPPKPLPNAPARDGNPLPSDLATPTRPKVTSHRKSCITSESSSPTLNKKSKLDDARDPSSPPIKQDISIELVEGPVHTDPRDHSSHSTPRGNPNSYFEAPLFLDASQDECKPKVTTTKSESKPSAQKSLNSSNFIDLTSSPDIPRASVIADERKNQHRSSAPSWEKKYLGGFMCEGYLIFSSARLREGDTVWLSRSSNGVSKKKAKSSSTKKEDHVVRLENKKNGAFARLNETFAKWIVKLIDHHLIHFEGTLMFPPSKASIGGTVHCYLKAYLFRSALVSPTHVMFDSLKNIQKSHLPDFSNTPERSEDQERMHKQQSINKLFDTIGLVPSTISSAEEKKSRRTADIQLGANATEDLDAGATIGQENIDLVYRKASANDASLGLQSPCDGFELDLRPYQQQGLSWLMKMETNIDEAREEVSIHPLWEEYIFPLDEDQTDCETALFEKFYYNPYMGELSLDFPRASRKCQGGILADEMGLGKTIQMAALICTARAPHNPLGLTASTKPETDSDVKPKLDDPFGSRGMQDSSTQNGVKHSSKIKRYHRKSYSTLVICPLTLIDQWKDELERCHKALKVFVYHSGSKDEIGSNKYDVVITTYGIVATEWGKLEAKSTESLRPSGLFKFDWYRIILDEGHNVRNRNALASRACYNLSGDRRWIISGTPIVNRLEDLASLLHFIRLEPWGNFGFYKSFVTTPFMKKDPKALIVVQTIIESVLLRREKAMKDLNGNSIVSLPPKHVSLKYLELNRKERMIYDLVYSNAKSEFLEYLGQGTVLRNVTAILAILMRLRQAVLHPMLVLNQMKIAKSRSSNDSKIVGQMLKEYQNSTDKSFAETQLKDLEKKLKGDEEAGEAEEQECIMCLDVMESRVYLPCMHAFCKDCIMAYIESRAGDETICPSCQAPFLESGIVEFVINRTKKPPSEPITPAEDSSPNNEEEESELTINLVINSQLDSQPLTKTQSTFKSNSQGDKLKGGYLKRNDFVSSTKLEALVAHLIEARQTDPEFSAVVFSQFTRFLDLIEQVLERDKFRFVRLDGSLTTSKRRKALTTFNEPGRSCILVCSLKVAGVGLNLVKANRVYMMDTWWNEAIENQAIDRIHRFGQEKPTYVVRFLASNTIEDRMLAIQKQKKAIINNALGGSGDQKSAQSQTLENFEAIFAD